jgi:NAD(P)H dehydrogenase (quinone)
MKIGIIIHSHTGNTLSVGERLKEVLLVGGCNVQLERVLAVNEDPNNKASIQLKSIPDIAPYDFLVIGAPVRGFSQSPVIKAYLSQLPDIHGKKVACYVTQHFPKPWLGGTRAIKQMIYSIEEKGGIIAETGIINWTGKTRENQISELIEKLSRNLVSQP